MIKPVSIDLKKTAVETLLVPVCEDKEIYNDTNMIKLVNSAKNIPEFKGAKGDILSLYKPDTIKVLRVFFFGLGKLEQLDHEALRCMAGKAVKTCIEKKLTKATLAVPSARMLAMEFKPMLQAIVEGAFLGNHVFDKYLQEKQKAPVKQLQILVPTQRRRNLAAFIKPIINICEGTVLARDWVSMPPNAKTPALFSRIISREASKTSLKVTILDEKALNKNGFGALLAVAAGSQNKPRLVILEYRPKKPVRTIALVGKGVTFDSGGINLKTTSSIKDMKMDMAGAATVAATLIAAAKIKLPSRIIGAIPIVENMPSGKATRPGDIVKSYNGKTVEISNTDAEGRLILIDAISYVIQKYAPDTVIDLATLTGACIVALGEEIAGLFSPNDKLVEAIIAAGHNTNEQCWRLPLPDSYKEQLKSNFADLQNLGKARWGGAVVAALFLSEFVGDTEWAHIDMAGPAYTTKESNYCGAGGTGFGVRLLCDLLTRLDG